MLSAGIVLFLVAVGLLIYLVKQKKPFTAVIALIPLAIIMIGFSSFLHVEVAGFTFDEKTASDYANNPDDPTIVAKYRAELSRLEVARAANPSQAITPEVQSQLASTADLLKNRPNLTPESRIALSHTFLLLGQTNQARTNLTSAIKVDTNLARSIDPRMKFLLKPVPR